MGAPFKRISRAEVPQEWIDAEKKTPPLETYERLGLTRDAKVGGYVCIELPDFPIARDWMLWYTSKSHGDDVGVIVSAQEQWNHRQEDKRATLRSLLEEGKSKLNFCIAYSP